MIPRPVKPRFVVVKGSSADYEGPVLARKEHPCRHRRAHGDQFTQPVHCRGPIQPREFYLRVRMGSWLEYDPVRIECLVAAGVIEVVEESR